MAGAYVASSVAYATSNKITPSLPTGWGENHLLVALCFLYGSGVTWNTPAGWTKVGNTTQLSSDWALFYKVLGSGEGNPTFTASGSANLVVSLHDFSGFATSSPLDDSSNTAYVTYNTTLQAAEVDVANQPVWAMICGASYDEGGAQAASVPSGYTERYDVETSNIGMYVATKEITSNGATGAVDATLAVETNMKHAFLVAFKLAAAGGSGVPKHSDYYHRRRAA